MTYLCYRNGTLKEYIQGGTAKGDLVRRITAIISTAQGGQSQQAPEQPSNQQLLNQLTAQPTGFYNQALASAPGGLQSQATGFPGQVPGLQPQATAYGQNPQPTGYNGPRPPMPPMPTGFQSGGDPRGERAVVEAVLSPTPVRLVDFYAPPSAD